MPARRISLLVEDLQPLLSAAPREIALPSLDLALERGDLARVPFTPSASHGPTGNSPEVHDTDALRFTLFGAGHSEPLPVAALTCLADRHAEPALNPGKHPGSDYYYLRADPVTLWADLARVILTSHGYADLDDMERNEIENTIRKVLRDEGMQFGSEHPERWTIALQQPLEFRFSPLKQAMGMDAAEMLPDQPEARHWRRILNEIQVALHSCPVNERRRQQGRAEVNSVWFWGQGFMPPVSGRAPFQAVYSNHPVSRGLGLIHDCVVRDLEAFDPVSLGAAEHDTETSGGTPTPHRADAGILVDWTAPGGSVRTRLTQLDGLVGQLLSGVRKFGLTLDVYAGDGRRWTLDRRRALRFWRRGGARQQLKPTTP